jgi:hypothetical protein
MRKTMFPRICLPILLAISSIAAGQTTGNPALPCFNALTGDARFAAIKDKVALGGTMEELRRSASSTGRAGPQEKPVLETWKAAREECRRLELPYYATRDLEIQRLAREHFDAVQVLIAELQAGALSYGDFAKRRIELFEKVNRDIETVRLRILPAKPTPRPVDIK